jgi:hypothetical protein
VYWDGKAGSSLLLTSCLNFFLWYQVGAHELAGPAEFEYRVFVWSLAP